MRFVLGHVSRLLSARWQAVKGLLVSLIVVVVSTGCTRQQDALVFRWAGSQPAQHPRSKSMVFFAEELERRTNGRIQVENYFSGVLGSEREVMDMVATGVLQGTRGGLFADANPKYKLFNLPFLVDGWDQALRLVNSEFTRNINYEARAQGYHVPCCGISQGFRIHTNNVRPIRAPDDLKGLKMRVPPQEVYLVTAQRLNANPQEIPVTEVYQAARTGVVDGQDNPASNIWDMKFHEVQKYMTITNYSTGPDPFFVSLSWFERLPEDLQRTFDQVAQETMKLSDQMNRESEQQYIDLLAAELTTNYLTPEATEQFRERANAVYDFFVEKGDFTWEEIREARRVAQGH